MNKLETVANAENYWQLIGSCRERLRSHNLLSFCNFNVLIGCAGLQRPELAIDSIQPAACGTRGVETRSPLFTFYGLTEPMTSSMP